MQTVVVNYPDDQADVAAGSQWDYTKYGYMAEHPPMEVTIMEHRHYSDPNESVVENVAQLCTSKDYRANFDLQAHLHHKVYCIGDKDKPGWNGTMVATTGRVTQHTQQFFGKRIIPDDMIGESHIMLLPVMETSEADGMERLQVPNRFILPLRASNMRGCRVGFFTRGWIYHKMFLAEFPPESGAPMAILLQAHLEHAILERINTIPGYWILTMSLMHRAAYSMEDYPCTLNKICHNAGESDASTTCINTPSE